METMTEGLTQIERLAIKLQALKPDVTSKDRTAASSKLNLSKETISRYLNGRTEIMDGDTAVSLIKFLEIRIADREKFI